MINNIINTESQKGRGLRKNSWTSRSQNINRGALYIERLRVRLRTLLAADRRFTTVDNITWTYQIHKVITLKKSRSLKLVKNSLRTIAISDADGVHVLW